MKTLIVVVFAVFILNTLAYNQTYTATLAIDNVDISNLNQGDEIVIPVKLVKKSGGKIVGFQLFIEYDHSIITWKGSHENPLNGIINFHMNLPYLKQNWLFNDNGIFLAVSWSDDTSPGIEILDGEILFEYIFTYNGGLNKNEELELVWGTTFQQEEGKVVRGETEMYSDLFDNYELTLINGRIWK